MNTSRKGKIYFGDSTVGSRVFDWVTNRGCTIRMFANMCEGIVRDEQKRRRALDKVLL